MFQYLSAAKLHKTNYKPTMSWFVILLKNCSVHPIIYVCEDWRFTRMWKALAWPHHFTKKGGMDIKSSLTPPLVIEVSLPSQESDGQSCICVLGVSMLSLSTILIFDFGIVSTMWYTAKPAHVVTSIQQSPVLRGHLY